MFVLLMLCVGWAAPAVAIADLQNQTGDASLDGAGAGVAGILVSRFQGSGAVQVVERDALESLLVEQQLTVDGLTDPRTAVRAGRILGADYLVVGEIFSVKLPSLSMALRVVDTETGEVVAARDVKGEIGDDGERFFEMIDQLSDAILEAMNVTLTEGQALGEIEQRELDAVLRYGEDLLRVNLEHPMSLYRESDVDFDRDAYTRQRWMVVDKRGAPVMMPTLARRLGDKQSAQAFIDRRRKLNRVGWVKNGVAFGVTTGGMVMFAAGADGTDTTTPVQLAGLGVILVGGTNIAVNFISQAVKRGSLRYPSSYYTPGEADRWIQKYNRSLDD